MGSFDWVVECELVGALLLSQQSNIIKSTDMGLYRYDSLIIIRNPNGPKLESYRKKIANELKQLGFKITIYTNLKIVNFLDVTLNLKKGTFEPYKKRMIHSSTYILVQSTHRQSSYEYQNQLVADYPIILPTSTFPTKTNTYSTIH